MGTIGNDSTHRTIINDTPLEILEHSKRTLANQIKRVDKYFRQTSINSSYSVWQLSDGSRQNVSIDAGDGHNTIDVWGGNNVDIYSGSGNDIINVSSAHGHVSINAGDGDNSVDVWGGGWNGADNVKVISGGGDDIINVNSARGHVHIDSGAGDDIVNVKAWAQTATVLAGEGKNKVSVANVWNTVNIKSGSGNDRIEVNSQYEKDHRSNNVVVDAGHGNNKIDIWQAENVKVRSGRGNDTINIVDNKGRYGWSDLESKVDVDAGDGRNLVNIFSFASAVSVAAGDGDDRITVTNANPYGYWHDGQTQNVSIDAGDGHNTIDVWGGNNVDIYSGSGNDIINVSSAHGHVSINAGDGDDEIYIFNSKNIKVDGGSGNDHIWLTECYSNNTVIFGTGSGHDYVHNSIDWNYDKSKHDYQSTIQLGDLNLNDITFKTARNQIIDTRTGMLVQTFDLLITIRNTGETLHYEHAFFKDKQLWDFNGLHFIKFADGTAWTMEQIADTISSTLDSSGNVLEAYCNLKNDLLKGTSNNNGLIYSDILNNQPYSNIDLGISSSNLNSNDKTAICCSLNEDQNKDVIFYQNQVDQLVQAMAGLVTPQGSVDMWHNEEKDDLYSMLNISWQNKI